LRAGDAFGPGVQSAGYDYQAISVQRSNSVDRETAVRHFLLPHGAVAMREVAEQIRLETLSPASRIACAAALISGSGRIRSGIRR
jgi:hypothetical protein